MLGEVHTGLLQHSTSLPPSPCERLLEFVRSEPVRRSERPIPHAASADLFTGVDCQLAAASGARVRGAGTVLHRATITGGRVVQGCAHTQVISGCSGRRQGWSHYLARPGLTELISKADRTDLARGFLNGHGRGTGAAGAILDLGAISARLIDRVQASPGLDRAPPFLAQRTKLRWTATTVDDPAAQQVWFRVEHGQLRTLALRCTEEHMPGVAALCEDLALHDWLLTTLLQLIERSQIGTGTTEQAVTRLRPAIDHLLHLWMPAARVPLELLTVWEALERRPGFSRQWQASVDRIRDQIAVGTISLLTAQVRGVVR